MLNSVVNPSLQRTCEKCRAGQVNLSVDTMINQYRRLHELSAPFENIPESYFYEFWNDFNQEPMRVRAFNLLETELQVLDQKAWAFLRNEASKLALKKDLTRGWTQLFEKLNEAKGYCYLMKLGCTNPAFIPREVKKNVETPDLKASLGDQQIFCEVKTINVSDELLEYRNRGLARDVQHQVSPGLAAKLVNTLLKAHSQLTSYVSGANITRIVYFVISFDDDLDYREDLNAQVHRIIDDLNCKGIEVAIHSEVA